MCVCVCVWCLCLMRVFCVCVCVFGLFGASVEQLVERCAADLDVVESNSSVSLASVVFHLTIMLPDGVSHLFQL